MRLLGLCGLFVVGVLLGACGDGDSSSPTVTDSASELEAAEVSDAGPVTEEVEAGPTLPVIGPPCVAGDDLLMVGSTYEVGIGASRFRVIFYEADVIRVWKATSIGGFSDSSGGLIVVAEPQLDVQTACFDGGDYHALVSDAAVLRVYKSPIRFMLMRPDNETTLMAEDVPMDYVNPYGMTQSIARAPDEHFYGGGMQNGYFSHRDRLLQIAVDPDYNWDDGGYPNPAPFFMSTAGYGMLRNTFKAGRYSFAQPLKISHLEDRFDAFYFVGDGLKGVLERYTWLTGRPFLAPIWGLEFGDADCYNKDGQVTADIVDIAATYRELDMPGGWVLPNDGYGCGYVDLPAVVDQLDALGFHTGLWTEDGLDQIAWEVGTAGTRAAKLDIAWVYLGYDFALNAAKTAAEGLEEFGGSRRFVWTTMGWAGTHRYAVMWTGDNGGGWEYIRMQIPTLLGSGLSAQNYATGDVDGIFWGSAQTYVRDLQWKVFTPALMTISGWAPEDRQPWRHGEPYTSYNRQALKLKMRLTPYLYTYANVAHQTGVPIVRAMVLEYPDDPKTWGTDTQYQFMSGDWFLVAPVYKNSTIRDGIYLPEGRWIDYWDGTEYEGPQTVHGYSAPLEKLPVFVKSGAIVPMWPEMLHYRDKPKDPMTLDVYPHGKTAFDLYEDDGVSLAHRDGAYSLQHIESQETDGDLQLVVGASEGTFEGKLTERAWRFEVHVKTSPETVLLDGSTLEAQTSLASLEAAASGWFFDATDRGGLLVVKTEAMASNASFTLEVMGGP